MLSIESALSLIRTSQLGGTVSHVPACEGFRVLSPSNIDDSSYTVMIRETRDRKNYRRAPSSTMKEGSGIFQIPKQHQSIFSRASRVQNRTETRTVTVNNHPVSTLPPRTTEYWALEVQSQRSCFKVSIWSSALRASDLVLIYWWLTKAAFIKALFELHKIERTLIIFSVIEGHLIVS